MTTPACMSPTSDFQRAAEAVLVRYPAAPASETETAIAVLALWALGAVESGQLAPSDADRVFTMLDVRIDEAHGGPALSDAVTQLVLEGEHFHHWGDAWGPDRANLRGLAFSILAGAALP